jgi:hypothetical protein
VFLCWGHKWLHACGLPGGVIKTGAMLSILLLGLVLLAFATSQLGLQARL